MITGKESVRVRTSITVPDREGNGETRYHAFETAAVIALILLTTLVRKRKI